ncbi:MAG: hypothetical protein ACFHU9_08860 [Fluviicola sp.]
MYKWTFFISIALLFTGCADLKQSEQLDRIREMEEKLLTLEKKLDAFDVALWEQWNEDAENTTMQLKQLEADTIPLETALDIDRYKNLKSMLPGVRKGQENCSNQVQAIQKRLEKLKNDIEEGNGRRDKYDEFLTMEEKEVALLEQKFALYQSTYKELKTEMPKAQERVNTIISERNLSEEVQ